MTNAFRLLDPLTDAGEAERRLGGDAGPGLELGDVVVHLEEEALAHRELGGQGLVGVAAHGGLAVGETVSVLQVELGVGPQVLKAKG